MAWTAPFVWTAGYVVTAAKLNEQLYYNMRYLKGLDGAATFESDLTVDNLITAGNVDGVDVSAHKAGTAKAQHTGGAGDHTHQSAGAEGATIDHGLGITGASLLDDDHTQYVLRSLLSTRGDLAFKGAAVWERLAKGTAGQYLQQGANDPAWAAAPSALTVAETEVFAGNSPGASAWTDLDLSGTVGAQATLVLLKIAGQADTRYAVRKNGDADEFYNNAVVPQGAAAGEGTAALHLVLVVATDNAGIIEWRSEAVNAAHTIDVIAYVK